MVMRIRGEPVEAGDDNTFRPVPGWTALTVLVRLLARQAAREAARQRSVHPPSATAGDAP